MTTLYFSNYYNSQQQQDNNLDIIQDMLTYFTPLFACPLLYNHSTVFNAIFALPIHTYIHTYFTLSALNKLQNAPQNNLLLIIKPR